jgi:hypothetical protein
MQSLVGITTRFVFATYKTFVLESIERCKDRGIGNLALVRLRARRHGRYLYVTDVASILLQLHEYVPFAASDVIHVELQFEIRESEFLDQARGLR